MVAAGRDDASTTAAVQDALCGSIAITTLSGAFSIADTNLSPRFDSGMESEEGTPTFGFAGLSSATPRGAHRPEAQAV